MKKHRKDQQEVDEKWAQIEGYELDKLRAEMEAKKQERINGRLQSRFRQVMLDWGVLRFPHGKELSSMREGDVIVVKYGDYTRWLNAEAMIDAADAKQEDRYFESFPEEKVKADARHARWMSETREMLRLVDKRI